MTASIREHLTEYTIDRWPALGAVNAYLAMPVVYDAKFLTGGVLISHGIADKGIRSGPNIGNSFDYVTVPGPAHADRLHASGYPLERIVIAGYPKLDQLFNDRTVRARHNDRIRVLYAPTHGGGGERQKTRPTPPAMPSARCTTWWRRDEILDQLDPAEFDVTVALHPRHRENWQATHDEYTTADVVIADGGSTIYEAWSLGLPVVFCDWISATANIDRGGLEGQIYREQLGHHAITPDQLPAMIYAAAGDGLGPAEQAFIDRVLPPDLRGCSGQLHAELLTSLER